MSGMFRYTKFNQNISKWNVSNISDMSWMFKNSKFNQNISNWITKLSPTINLSEFGILNNIKIRSYKDFKQYHRQLILNKL